MNLTSDKLKPLLDKIGVTARIEAARPHVAKKALLELMDEVEQKVHHFRKECWNITIELLADHLGLMTNPWKYSLPNVKWAGPTSKPSYPGFQQLKEHIQQTNLIEAYITAAKAQPWDYLGDVFVEEELAGRHNRLGQMLTPKAIVDFMVKLVGVGETEENAFGRPDEKTWSWLSAESWNYELKLLELSRELRIEYQRQMHVLGIEPIWEKYAIKPQTVIDPAGVGTGRFLIQTSVLHPKAPLILFGIEIDLSLYRACLVNMAMFSNHPYSIICADALMLDIEKSGPAGKLWDFGNQWTPPDVSMFYYKPPPPFKFTLKDYALQQKAKRALEDQQAVEALAAKQAQQK